VHPRNNHHVPEPRPNEAFNALVNLVVLLQTLDEDGDPQNGIKSVKKNAPGAAIDDVC
jgi:hypothetical protein